MAVFFFSITAVQWSTYTEQNVRLGSKFMHHLPLVMHANFCKNQSLGLSEKLTHEQWLHVNLELRMKHVQKKKSDFSEIFLVGFWVWVFFFGTNIRYDILGGRWQISLRHDKIARNTPPAVLHCFRILLFNKKMTPSAWMTTPKWTINIPYIRRS